jgi:hypothetical protein
MFDIDKHNFNRQTLVHMIIGHEYFTVCSRNYSYLEILRAMEEELGDKFQKPVVLLSVATMENGFDPEDCEWVDFTFSR